MQRTISSKTCRHSLTKRRTEYLHSKRIISICGSSRKTKKNVSTTENVGVQKMEDIEAFLKKRLDKIDIVLIALLTALAALSQRSWVKA